MRALGYVLALPAGILTWLFVGSIPNMLGNYGGWAALFVCGIGPVSGLGAACGIVALFESLANAEEQRSREAAEAAAKAAAQAAQAAARATAEAAERVALARRKQEELQLRITIVRQLCSEAQSAALSLPTALAAADLALDRADEEFNDGLYSPFWEAMEAAAEKLLSFDYNVNLITAREALHRQESETLGELAPPFSLGGAIVPEPAVTQNRLRTMYRRAQKNSEFANIYEQRRIAAKVDRTNAILGAGFSSLGDAIQGLGSRIADSIHDLRATVDFRVGTLQSSLENAVAAAAKQRDAMLTELRQSHGIEESVLQQLRKDANRRSEHERDARRMLDNIQRRKDPRTGERY